MTQTKKIKTKTKLKILQFYRINCGSALPVISEGNPGNFPPNLRRAKTRVF